MVSSYTLESFLNIAHLMNDLHVQDYAIAVADLNKYLGYYPGKTIDHKVKAGDKVKEGTSINLAMTEKRRIVKVMDSSLFGFPYIAVAIPIIEQGWAVGAISFMESIERQERLFQLSQGLYNCVSQLYTSYQEIAAESEEYIRTGRKMSRLAERALNNASLGEEIIELTKNISDKASVLGVNTAANALQLGENGRNIEAISKEISNFANTTNEAIIKIEIILEEFRDTIFRVVEESKRIDRNSGHQLKMIQEVRSSIGTVYAMIENLRNEAENLVRDVDEETY